MKKRKADRKKKNRSAPNRQITKKAVKKTKKTLSLERILGEMIAGNSNYYSP